MSIHLSLNNRGRKCEWIECPLVPQNNKDSEVVYFLSGEVPELWMSEVKIKAMATPGMPCFQPTTGIAHVAVRKPAW